MIKFILFLLLIPSLALADCKLVSNNKNWRSAGQLYKTPMEHVPTIGIVALPTNNTYSVEVLDQNKKLIKKLSKWSSGPLGDIYHSSLLGSNLKKKYGSIYIRVRRGKKGENCKIFFVKDPTKRSDVSSNL